jgi:NADH dehydrogenase FAD-containing subunit
MDEVLKIDTTKKYVILADQIISYDYLIVAAGVTHNYFGNNHWATWPRDSKPYPKQQKFEAEFYGPLKPQRSAQTTIRNKI